MKTADGYPVVCYGAKGKYGIHRICRRCAIYRKYDSIPEKPCYRLHGIHLLGRRECPIFEQKIIKITKNKQYYGTENKGL